MMRTWIFLCLLFLTSGAAFAQQGRMSVYGQNIEERASTRLGYWKTNVNAGVGEVVVSYGRPPWKDQYAQQLDTLTVGKMWRMGDNFWTLLDTNLPVRFGDVEVAVGLYYLAIRRSQDGADWELVFIDPTRSRKKGLDSYDVGTRPAQIPILFSTPMKFEESKGTTKKLTMLLKLNSGSQTDGTFKLSWGNFSLTAPVSVRFPSQGGK